MSPVEETSPKAFISYCHYDGNDNYRDRVLNLADRLRDQGIDCEIDQFYEDTPPDVGWPEWMNRQIQEADFVLVVCTETYFKRFHRNEDPDKGLGAQWEGAIITQSLYDSCSRNTRFIPIGFMGYAKNNCNIPVPLRGTTYRDVSVPQNFEQLYRQITKQPTAIKRPLGAKVSLSPKNAGDPTSVSDMTASALPDAAVSAAQATPLSVSTDVPLPSIFFTGRDDMFDALDKAFEQHTAVALSGIGGLGKTQISLRYASLHHNNYSYLFFVNADSVDTIRAAYMDIARRVDLPQKELQESDVVVAAVLKWLQETPKWFIIADNADDLSAVRHLLPFLGLGKLLISTREAAIGGTAGLIRVPYLSDDDGATLLLRRAHLLASTATLDIVDLTIRNDAIKLSQEMGGLPLALEQAGSYIDVMQLSPADYLTLYEQNAKELLNHASYNSLQEHAPAWATFNVNFVEIAKRSKAAADLLRLCSLMAADPIPEEIFLIGATFLGSALSPLSLIRLNELVGEARRFSLLSRDITNHTLVMHSIVQQVIRTGLDKATHHEMTERMVRAIDCLLPDVEFSKWQLYERLLPHAIRCLGYIAEEKFEFPEALHLMHQIAWYFNDRVQFAQAEMLYQKALELREKVLGPDHPDTAKTLNNLGSLYRAKGQSALAEPMLKRALDICEKVLGPDDFDTATVLSNLGGFYQDKGQYALAESMLKRSLAIRQKVLVPNHPDIATTLNNLGILYQNKGQVAQAEDALKRALEIREKVLGPDHPDTATALSNLGEFYVNKGQSALAEPMFKRALNISEETLGSDHPNTAVIYKKLGGLYLTTGRLTLAEPMLKKALSIYRRVWGKKDSRTEQLCRRYVQCLRQMGRPDLVRIEEKKCK